MKAQIEARNPKAEAQDFLNKTLGADNPLEAFVLEPSPPALGEPWFADDPAVPDKTEGSITPTSAGETSWNELCRSHSEVSDFARDRWLGDWANLPALPSDWLDKMEDAHRLAFGVVAEARKLATTKFGLRYTKGGFGTPFFDGSSGKNIQVRVLENHIVLQKEDEVSYEEISTLQKAGDFLKLEPSETQREHDSPELGDPNRKLNTDIESISFLGQWFGLTAAVLEEIRAETGETEAGRVQLWPGHFDMAAEFGQDSQKATFGASPGDRDNPEPYLYVGPWAEIKESDPFWNASSFTGAKLDLQSFKDSSSHHQAVLDFYRKAINLLSAN